MFIYPTKDVTTASTTSIKRKTDEEALFTIYFGLKFFFICLSLFRSHTPSDNASILTNNTVEVVPPNSIDNEELPQPDPRIYGEFVLFLQQLSQSKSLVKSIGLTFMRRCIQEDVEPAMFMLKKANVLRTIEATMENRLFIEATENTVSVGPNSSSDMIHESCCSACDHPMMTLPYPDRRPRGGNIIANNFLFF